MADKKLTRAQRNNNPGNIMYSGIKWDGMVGVDPDGFIIFSNPDMGWRAMVKNTINRAAADPKGTLNDYIQRYASTSSEEERRAYVDTVAKKTGTTPDTILSTYDPYKLSQSMADVETGNTMQLDQGTYERIKAMLNSKKKVTNASNQVGKESNGSYDETVRVK